MTIKVWDYLEQYEEERPDILEAVEKVLRSGRLILGDSVRNFETAFASYCECKYAVGVDNATHGLTLALRALGIGQEQEVITVSNTAVPTVSAIVSAGATPRFVDIDPRTYLMDVSQLGAALTDRTACIMPVHLFGQCVDMTSVSALAKQRGIKVIEDCSQAHGARHFGKRAGSLSDLSVFSFYPTKPLGAFGDGGIVLTQAAELNAKLRRLRFYGMETTYYSEEHGYNARLDELQAEILLRKLSRLDGYIDKRRALTARYNQILEGTSLILPQVAEGNYHVYYIYVARHAERDRIIRELATRDIVVNVSYPWPIHMMRGYGFLNYKEGDLPHTESAAKEIFSLPMYPELSYADQDKVCTALGEILGERHKVAL